jgi:hypothetical protein
MRNFLLGVATTLLLLAAAAAYVWHYESARLPAEWRRANPNSIEYRPVLYRWKDAAGVVQVTDRPPPDRPYETLRIDPATNVAPLAPPRRE